MPYALCYFYIMIPNYLSHFSSFLRSLVIFDISSMLVRIVGVRKINNSVFLFSFEVVLNNGPITGISPRKGILLVPQLLFSDIRPPRAMLSPWAATMLVVILHQDCRGVYTRGIRSHLRDLLRYVECEEPFCVDGWLHSEYDTRIPYWIFLKMLGCACVTSAAVTSPVTMGISVPTWIVAS